MYEYAAAEEAEEITVEDPNPHFRVLRDAVDLRNCLRLGLMRPAPGKPSTDTYKAGAAALRRTWPGLTWPTRRPPGLLCGFPRYKRRAVARMARACPHCAPMTPRRRCLRGWTRTTRR